MHAWNNTIFYFFICLSTRIYFCWISTKQNRNFEHLAFECKLQILAGCHCDTEESTHAQCHTPEIREMKEHKVKDLPRTLLVTTGRCRCLLFLSFI